jgi:multiple sugar transport system permease protein
MSKPSLAKQESRWAFWLLLPALLGIGLFTGLPMLGSLGLSFTQWDLLGTPRWVGLANYMDQKVRALGLLRTAYFMPVVCSMVAGAILWSWIFDPRFGALNAAITAFGMEPVRWLSDSHWALPSLVVVSVWKNLGYDMLLFLAGLQGVPKGQLEAASLDGANAWQRFWNVTLPLLGPSLVMVTMLATIRAFQTFDTVYLMTEGGPHRSTTIVGYWLFQNAFTTFKLGKASALAYVLFMALLALSALQWWARKRLSHQED